MKRSLSFNFFNFFAMAAIVLCGMEAEAKFLPDNDLGRFDSLSADTGISEDEFNEVIDRAVAFYAPLIEAHGGVLRFQRRWEDPTVNASAIQFGEDWYVTMYGGLARRKEITKDGFTMVVCHEVGHHMAGFPFVFDWASNEGNSDYFAGLSCARNLWVDDLDQNAEAAATIADEGKELCDGLYFSAGQERLDLCYRQINAAYSVSDLMSYLNGEEISWTKHDQKVVTRMDDAHPAAQCRFDTYVAGSLCDAVFDAELIPSTEKLAAKNSCHQAEGYRSNLRPRCWFKPELSASASSH